MHIFRLPASRLAHLNAFRVNVLNISPRFRIPPFSIHIRHHRVAPPCSLFPGPLRRASSRFSSRLIVSLYPVLVPLCSPLLSSSHLFPSTLPPSHRPVASILVPLIVSCDRGAGRSRSSRSAVPATILSISVAFPLRTKLALYIVSPCGEGSG